MDNASWATYWWLNYARSNSNTFDVESVTKKIGFVTSNLILLIMIFLQWGLKEEELASNVVCFDVDGVKTFKASNLKLQFKSNINILHLSLMCII
jgi:hypothetical protein